MQPPKAKAGKLTATKTVSTKSKPQSSPERVWACQNRLAWRGLRNRLDSCRPASRIGQSRIHETQHFNIRQVRLRSQFGLAFALCRKVWSPCIRHPNLNRTKPRHAQRSTSLLNPFSNRNSHGKISFSSCYM